MEENSENRSTTTNSENMPLKSSNLGLGALLLIRTRLFCVPRISYRIYILILTFVIYAAYHMSRKPFSVVANVLAPDCHLFESGDKNYNTSYDGNWSNNSDTNTPPGWPPFNGHRCKTLIGAVDYSWLFTYAIFLFISGLIADRVSLRYFLTVGMIGSGICVGLLGVAYFANIHNLAYFIVVQIGVGVFESTGWPGVVAVIGNWFGKKRRGLLLGVWNSHTSVGNILGTAIPAIWAVQGRPWGWSFLVPAIVMIVVGVITFFFLVIDPSDVGLPPAVHNLEKTYQVRSAPTYQSSSSTKNAAEALDLSSKKEKDDKIIQRKEFSETTFTDVQENDETSLIPSPREEISEEKEAIGLIGALRIPGVVEYSLALFFIKLVAYTFLFWLPYYIFSHPIAGEKVGEMKADLLATFYDVGGIIGGISTGAISDFLDSRAISCVLMMYLSVPTLFLYRSFGSDSYALTVVLVMLCGLFINGPYTVITTAVSNDLGTHKSLKDNTKAKATVGAIIDGMGSLGAACGPLITGWVSDDFGWSQAFYVLMISCFLSSLSVTRILLIEVRYLHKKIQKWNLQYRN